MKLVEKKCPNCSGQLKFNENDKSCKCEYCKSEFEIERNMSQTDFLNQFDLKPLKRMSIFIYITFLIIFLLTAAFILTIFTSIFKSNTIDTNIKDNFNNNTKIVKNIDELSNFDIKGIETSSKLLIGQTAEGVNDLNYSFKLNGNINIEKTYLAFKNGSNYVITICKARYQNFFNQDSVFTVYIPVVFQDVKSNSISSTYNGEVSAPEFYLNDEKTTFVHAYSSFDEAYNNVVKPLKTDYKISEK